MGSMAKGAFTVVRKHAADYLKKQVSAAIKKAKEALTLSTGTGAGPKGSVSFGPGFRMTDRFGWRTINGKPNLHRGYDYAAPAGTPVRSQSGGVVRFSGWGASGSGYGGFGNVVHIDAGNGISHLYAHHSKNIVRTGQTVSPGMIVGLVGNTGFSFGNHLHYERRKNNVPYDYGGGQPMHEQRGGVGGQLMGAMKAGLGKIAGYAEGGFGIDKAQLAWIAEGGWAESIISHDPAKRTNQQKIWEQTGDALGFSKEDLSNSRFIELLERIAEGVEDEKIRNIIMSDRVVGKMVEETVTRIQDRKKETNERFRGGWTR